MCDRKFVTQMGVRVLSHERKISHKSYKYPSFYSFGTGGSTQRGGDGVQAAMQVGSHSTRRWVGSRWPVPVLGFRASNFIIPIKSKQVQI